MNMVGFKGGKMQTQPTENVKRPFALRGAEPLKLGEDKTGRKYNPVTQIGEIEGSPAHNFPETALLETESGTTSGTNDCLVF